MVRPFLGILGVGLMVVGVISINEANIEAWIIGWLQMLAAVSASALMLSWNYPSPATGLGHRVLTLCLAQVVFGLWGVGLVRGDKSLVVWGDFLLALALLAIVVFARGRQKWAPAVLYEELTVRRSA